MLSNGLLRSANFPSDPFPKPHPGQRARERGFRATQATISRDVAELGLIKISLEFNLSFTYDGAKDKAYGRATLTVKVEIAFFSTSVEVTLERAAFLLHDVFGLGFDEVAATIERDEAACRQLAARARVHVREARPRFKVEKQRGLALAVKSTRRVAGCLLSGHAR